MRYRSFCCLLFFIAACSPKESSAPTEALVYLTLNKGSADLYQSDVLGKWERKLANNSENSWSPEWNAGLEKLIYKTTDSLNNIAVWSMDLVTKEITELPNGHLANYKLSANGNKILYTQSINENQHIWWCDVSGKNEKQLTTDGSFNGAFSVSGDGSQLLYVSNQSGNYELYTMNLINFQVRQLTNNNMIEEYSSWSPDGTQIAFTLRNNEEGSKEDIYIMNADGTNQYQLTKTPYSEREVAWSLSGKKIAFHGTTENDGDQIYTIDLADGKFTKITSGDYYRGAPTWIPIDN